jgi:hypothetical protein
MYFPLAAVNTSFVIVVSESGILREHHHGGGDRLTALIRDDAG